MSLQIGQEIEHSQWGRGIVTAILNGTKIKATFDDEEFEKIVDPKFLKGYSAAGAAILSLESSSLHPAFLTHLTEHKPSVSIRVHYPKHAESFVFDLFSRECIQLPEDIRAINSGSRGGFTTQRTLAGVMTFPKPQNLDIIPHPFSVLNETVTISVISVILAVLKAGFQVTTYAKITD